MRSRASVLNLTSLAAIVVRSLDCSGMSWDQAAASGRDNDSPDVRLLHDQVFVAVALDLGPRPLAEQDAVARLHVPRLKLALFIAGAGADPDDLTLSTLPLGHRKIVVAGSMVSLSFD